MPTPLPKPRADGTLVYRVRFRHAGHSTSETFYDLRRAEWFCRQIELHGVRFALRALAALEAENNELDTDTPTLDTVAREFLIWKRDYVRSEMTIDAYTKHYDAHISPTLGKIPVDQITTDDVQAWVERMVTGKIGNTRTKKPRKLHPKTIRARHALLHAIMGYAADPRRALITANPCAAKTELPEKIKPIPKGLMPMQWQALERALRQVDADAADLAAFLIGSGWRIGEGMGLPAYAVEDYGPDQPMWVTMDQVARKGKHVTTVAKLEGKAQMSMRRIKIDADTAAVVRRHMVGKAPGDLVFTRAGGGAWQHHNFRYALDKAADAAGLPHVTAHALRHTHVVWLAMSGTPLPELQKRIGHADISTTLGVYGRAIGDVSADVLDKFAAMRDSTPSPVKGVRHDPETLARGPSERPGDLD